MEKYYWICSNCGDKMYELVNLDLLDKEKRFGKKIRCEDFLKLDGSKVGNKTRIQCDKCGYWAPRPANPKFMKEEIT